MTFHELKPHTSVAPLAAVHAVAARASVVGTLLHLEYRLRGDLAQLAIPPRTDARRADRLWEHTCFEAFVAAGPGSGYCELNVAPSTAWAAYAFDGYRQGMRPLDLAAPSIEVAAAANELSVTAAVVLAALPDAPWPRRVGLTAVVEDRAGRRGYFALHHPRATPDFHDAAGFAVLLDGSFR